MAAFDINGARKAGYSDAEIADHLASQSNFDAVAARKAGYGDSAIISHLATPTGPKTAVAGDVSRETPTDPGRAARIAAQTEADRKTYDPTVGMNSTEKVLAGVGKAFSDTGRGIGQLAGKGLDLMSSGASQRLGLPQDSDIAETRRLDTSLMNTGEGMTGNIGGNVLMALAPGGALKGAASALNIAKAAPGAASSLNALGSALLVPRSVKGAAALGAGLGAAQPAVDTGDRLLNTGLGAVGNAIVPAAGVGYRTAKSALEPFYASGQQAIVGRALTNAAGSDAPNVLARLKDASTPFLGPVQGVQGELVPGSLPTVAEAAANPGISALSRAATAVNPQVTNDVVARSAANNQARSDLLRNMAGTTGERDFTAANRDATAQQLYDAAFSKGIDPAAITPQIQKAIGTLSENPYVKDALPLAQKLAAADGIDINAPGGSLQGMHYLKLALDSALDTGTSGATAVGKNMKRQITDARSKLLGVMDSVSGDYAAARKTYASMSRPLNQMDTAQQLADKAIDPLTGVVRPSAFARALNDTAASKATGYGGATLENTFDAGQQNSLQRLLEDLQRSNSAQNAGRGVGSDTVQKLAYSNMLDQAGVPTWLRSFMPSQVLGNVAGRAGDVAYGRANKEISARLAESMLDPRLAAEMMQTGGMRDPNMLYRLLLPSASAATLALPGTVNAQKQQGFQP